VVSLKGSNNPAEGNALGTLGEKRPALEGQHKFNAQPPEVVHCVALSGQSIFVMRLPEGVALGYVVSARWAGGQVGVMR
jgi:hypothetical protein